MAIFTWDQLLKTTTAAEVKGTLYGYMSGLGLSVNSWQALAPTRVVTDAVSRIIAATINNLVTINRGGYKDFAEREWLETLSKQTYGVDKILSTFALGEFVADNAGGGVYAYDPDEIVFRKRGTTKTYTNIDAVLIGSFETGVSIQVRANEEGSASSAGPGELDLVTTMTGVSGSNLQAVVGLDAETDPELRARDDHKIEALSPNGPPGIYEYVAKTPELNGGVAINRARVLPPPGTGAVTVVVASTLGPISAPEVALIQIGIDLWATPITVTATVVSATAAILSYGVTVHIQSVGGPTDAVLAAAVKTTMIAYMNAVPIGGVQFTPGIGVVSWRGLLGAVENTLVGETRPVIKAVLSNESDVNLLETDVVLLAAADITVTVVRI